LLDPGRWSLKGRFLYITGALLFLGNFILIGYLYIILEENITTTAADRLTLLREVAAGEVRRMQDTLHAQALALADIRAVQEGLEAGEAAALRALLVPYENKIRHGLRAQSAEFRLAPREAGGQAVDPAAAQACERHAAAMGVRVEDGRPVVYAVVPVLRDTRVVGTAMAAVSLCEALAGASLPPEYGLAVLVPEAGGPADGAAPGLGERLVVASSLGRGGQDLPSPEALRARPVARKGHVHATLMGLADSQGRQTAGVVVSYNAALLGQAKWNRINLFAWFFIGGALVLWFALYANVARIERFFSRLKKIIISSHSNYFGERFEADHLHCLDVMHCHNEECPVYQNPSLVCYLETGSEAISPRWRDTCIFLNKYDSCKACPVYAMRRGDELTEMRNVVNTMMRLWSNFLGRVGHLMAYVLRSQEHTGQMPSLDEISDRLEEMAKLTFFSRDLQGVLNKEEVYAQLGHVFSDHFGLHRLLLFEVRADDGSMDVVLDRVADQPLCRDMVLRNTDACRACRTAEDVVSFYNPVLCPYFNCDQDKDVRCCLPMVMGGKVGGVATFLAPRRDWDGLRKQLPILRKYLDEAAPVLSSLRLLMLSKEQALHDPLTRCHNRRFLDEFITTFEPLADRENRTTGLLMCDIDYFKQVNDEYGHEAGDAVLKQLVTIIQATIRKTDLLVRYGGEEFLALLQNVEPGASEAVGEKIRATVEQTALRLPGGNTIRKTISVGVAEFPQDGPGMYKAIKFADVALYEAKRAGRNKVMRFVPTMWTDQEY
jgi:diguanylate cyclase (GGDEF)-like protein